MTDDEARTLAEWKEYQSRQTGLGRTYLGPTGEALEKEVEAIHERHRRADRRRRTSVPPLYAGASFEDFTPGDFSAGGVETWDRGNILVRGSNGAGKSHLGAAYANAHGALYVSCIQTAIRIRSSFHGVGTELEILAEIQEPDIVVLDDIFAPASTDFWCSSLLAILEHRITRNLVTIATTDRSLEQIDARDSSVASRLASFTQVVLKGGDRRLRRQKEAR